MTEQVTSHEVILSLRRYLNPHGGAWSKSNHYAFFDELRTGTGYGKDNEQRIDAWAIDLYPSNRLERLAFEIKVSRGDFKQEMRKPKKRRYALIYSNRFYFVAPAGMIAQNELPIEAGLIEYSEGKCNKVLEAPFRDSFPPTWNMVASLARRITKLESEKNTELPDDVRV